MGISLFLGGSKRLPRWFGALTVFGSIQSCKMARKKVPQSARLSAGGGKGGSLFGQCPNVGGVNSNGSSLSNRNLHAKELTDGVEALHSLNKSSRQGRRSNCCRLKVKTKKCRQQKISLKSPLLPVGRLAREVQRPLLGPIVESHCFLLDFKSSFSQKCHVWWWDNFGPVALLAFSSLSSWGTSQYDPGCGSSSVAFAWT